MGWKNELICTYIDSEHVFIFISSFFLKDLFYLLNSPDFLADVTT